VQAVNPKLLIFVEGTSGNNFPVEQQANMAGYWWGGQSAAFTTPNFRFDSLVYLDAEPPTQP